MSELQPLKIYDLNFEPNTIVAPDDFKSEWREKMTDEEYHADKTAVGSSSARQVLKSGLAFAGALWGKPRPDTDSLKFGRLVHMAMLEPTKFKAKYVLQPEFWGIVQSGTNKGQKTNSLNSADVKRQLDAWRADLPSDVVIVTQDEKEKILCMVDSVLSHPTASLLLQNIKTEIAGYFRHESGIRCKFKPDILPFDCSILPDLKTTTDSDWDSFRRSVENYRYDIQMAMYNDGVHKVTGIKPEHNVWIAVESVYPYETRVHEVDPEYKIIGASEYQAAIKKISTMVQERSFPSGQLDVVFTEPSFTFRKKYQSILGASNG